MPMKITHLERTVCCVPFLIGKAIGWPLCRIFGGKFQDRILVDYWITRMGPEDSSSKTPSPRTTGRTIAASKKKLHERRLPLVMGPDADDPAARFEIRALTRGGSADTKVLMRLNHTLLKVVSLDGRGASWYHAGGRNDLAICCSDALAKTANPMIVHEVLSAAIY